MSNHILGTILILWCALPGVSQQVPPPDSTQPLYRVTVVDRDIEAVNYQYRSGPTGIGFTGTVLLTTASGDATVESQRGHTAIDAHFNGLAAPTRFGREYLTYVLWAISPDGAPHNLGEIVPGSSNKAKLSVTTDMQAFGMIVTAEPYSSVRQPSDVVVLESKPRPDTIGRIQPIHVKYELMPRGSYTFEVGGKEQSKSAGMPKVSMKEYESTLEVYQARNAVEIAQAGGAAQLAPNTFAQAQQSLAEAERLLAQKADMSLIVQAARGAQETASDARLIAERRGQEQKLAQARQEVAAAQQAQAQAQATAQQAQAEAAAARAQAEAEHAARTQAETEAMAARNAAAQGDADRVEPPPPAAREDTADRKKELRMLLLERLNSGLDTRDTPRGLVVTVPAADFDGASLRPKIASQLRQIAAAVESQPGLRVEVQGYSDSAGDQAGSRQKAEAVQSALIAQGAPPSAVTAQGLGNSRPVASDATAEGRRENQRVEIVITGDPIGTMPFWDHPYAVMPRQ
jgi:outer membrane protein OmpA-like peptidoglycan-associated protein